MSGARNRAEDPGTSGTRVRNVVEDRGASVADTSNADASNADGGSVLAQLLSGQWRDPDGGDVIAAPPVSVAIENTLAGREAAFVEALRLGRRVAVVSDATTHEIMGGRVEQALRPLGPILSIILERAPHADVACVERLRQASRDADALVAVGSGTINDLCKYAAAQDGKPYAVFATAPSMNGYTSPNAAITVDGHKKTLGAVAARGVFVDLQLLCAAPVRMIRAGLGDSVCRSTAQADWLLSHRLLGTPYRRAPFALLAADEPMLLATSDALVAGDVEAMRVLARTLILSGLGMAICGGSHPASQAEHLISHYIDMRAPPSRPAYFHGEQVAVATLTMARLQEAMIDGAPPLLAASTTDRAELERRMGEELGHACWEEFRAKRIAADQAQALNARIGEHWAAWVAELRSHMVPATQLEAALRRAGAPQLPADIGVAPDFYAEAVANARLTRNRYTFLDLAADAGQLERLTRHATPLPL